MSSAGTTPQVEPVKDSKDENESTKNQDGSGGNTNEEGNKSSASSEPKPRIGLTVRTGMKGKPKPLYLWNTQDVNKWLRKHGGLYYDLYGELLSKHEITGRTLIRMTDIKLEKIGIVNSIHRHDLMQHILRLRLKHETSDLKNLCQRGSGFELPLPDKGGGGGHSASSGDKLTVDKYAAGK